MEVVNTVPAKPRFYISSDGYLHILEESGRYTREDRYRFIPTIAINGKAIPTLDGRLYMTKTRSAIEVTQGSTRDRILECFPVESPPGTELYIVRSTNKILYRLLITEGNDPQWIILENSVEKLIGRRDGWSVAAVNTPSVNERGIPMPKWYTISSDEGLLIMNDAWRKESDGTAYDDLENDTDIQPMPNPSFTYRGTVIVQDGLINPLVYDVEYNQDYFDYVEGSGEIDVACELDERITRIELKKPKLLALHNGELQYIYDFTYYYGEPPLYPRLGPWKDILSLEGRAYLLSQSRKLYSTYLRDGELQLEEVVPNI